MSNDVTRLAIKWMEKVSDHVPEEFDDEGIAVAKALYAALAKQEQGEPVDGATLATLATLAGLETSIAILSELVDAQRAILVDVERICGVDGHGGPLEDGESVLIDRVRTHLAMTTAPQPTQPEQGEPVGEAYLCDVCHTPFDGAYECPACGNGMATKEPVYTHPQLKRELIRNVLKVERTSDQCVNLVFRSCRAASEFEIEAAHGIKGVS